MVNNERLYAIAKEKWPCSNMSCHSILHSVVDAVADAVRAECGMDSNRIDFLETLLTRSEPRNKHRTGYMASVSSDMYFSHGRCILCMRSITGDADTVGKANSVRSAIDAAMAKQEPKT